MSGRTVLSCRGGRNRKNWRGGVVEGNYVIAMGGSIWNVIILERRFHAPRSLCGDARLMPPILRPKQDRDTLLLGSKARRRPRQRDSNPRVADKQDMDERDRGAFTTSRDLTFSNGEWRGREVVETAVIVKEPRGSEKQDRDDGDSGISETAVEERLLPAAAGEGGRAPEFVHTKKETVLETLIQVFIPFMIAGFGMMAAGLLLDAVQVMTRHCWNRSTHETLLEAHTYTLTHTLTHTHIGQHWDVYRNINEIFILVPALLGLKGNLEMTLASRLSTAVREPLR